MQDRVPDPRNMISPGGPGMGVMLRGALVKALRERANLSQDDLGRSHDPPLTKFQIGGIERGDIAYPLSMNWEKLFSVLQVTRSMFLRLEALCVEFSIRWLGAISLKEGGHPVESDVDLWPAFMSLGVPVEGRAAFFSMIAWAVVDRSNLSASTMTKMKPVVEAPMGFSSTSAVLGLKSDKAVIGADLERWRLAMSGLSVEFSSMTGQKTRDLARIMGLSLSLLESLEEGRVFGHVDVSDIYRAFSWAYGVSEDVPRSITMMVMRRLPSNVDSPSNEEHRKAARLLVRQVVKEFKIELWPRRRARRSIKDWDIVRDRLGLDPEKSRADAIVAFSMDLMKRRGWDERRFSKEARLPPQGIKAILNGKPKAAKTVPSHWPSDHVLDQLAIAAGLENGEAVLREGLRLLLGTMPR